MNHLQGLLLVAELGHVELQVRLVEKPQADLLAEQGRQAVDPVVHVLAAGQLDLDAPVLGQAPLGDVHLGHDLEAGDDGVLELHRRLHDLVEDAVDPVADPERLLVGFDMDIGGLALDGVGEDQVDQLDDRGILARLFQGADIDIVLLVDQLEVDILEISHDLGEGGALVVILVDGLLDRLPRRPPPPRRCSRS